MRASWFCLLLGLLMLPAVAARADCDPNRMLNKVTNNGSIVQLDNDSQWQVDELDRSTLQDWKPDAPITACTDELINREEHESVQAREIKRGFQTHF